MGVKPDVVVEITEDNIVSGVDPVVEAAVLALLDSGVGDTRSGLDRS